MKRFFLPAFVAFGIATLCLLAVLGPLISPSHTVIFHTSAPAVSLFATVLFDLFALWAAVTVLLLLAERPGRRQFMIWAAILLALPLIVLKNISVLMGFMVPRWLDLSIAALACTAFVALSLCWKPSFVPAFARVQRFLIVVFGFVALNGIGIVGQLLWYGWQVRALNAPQTLHQRSVGSVQNPPHARVIWILFDELSYQQVYGQRFPGLALPAFDALAQQATVFTHVIPAGAYTEEVVPSLLTGWPVDAIRASSNGQQLFLHDPATGKWRLFDQHQTIFQDALNDGYSTAVAGWYNPYCRILPQVLDRCFWTLNLPYPGGIVARQSVTRNVLSQLAHRVDSVSALLPGGHRSSSGFALETQLHVADYDDLYQAADAMLNDPGADFLFLHMPIPHPHGIYDRRRGVMTTRSSSYIDNLALADKYLAHVRALLQKRGEWDTSTIVIMGDHSWRTSFIWSKMGGWTPEDAAASHGAHFDDRPGYIVKLPHQQQGARIDTPFKAIHTRALLDQLLAGQLSTPEALDTWAKAQK
jgi:Sulfatase.